jgi:hypothetical protein
VAVLKAHDLRAVQCTHDSCIAGTARNICLRTSFVLQPRTFVFVTLDHDTPTPRVMHAVTHGNV